MAAECCSKIPKNTNGRLAIPALAGLLVLKLAAQQLLLRKSQWFIYFIYLIKSKGPYSSRVAID